MKILLLCISLLVLTGCDENVFGPDFKVGDCVVYEDSEAWEKDEPKLILEVGKQKYRFMYLTGNILRGHESDQYIKVMDRIYEKTECPK